MAEVGPVRDLDRRSASLARRAMGDERCPHAVPAQSDVRDEVVSSAWHRVALTGEPVSRHLARVRTANLGTVPRLECPLRAGNDQDCGCRGLVPKIRTSSVAIAGSPQAGRQLRVRDGSVESLPNPPQPQPYEGELAESSCRRLGRERRPATPRPQHFWWGVGVDADGMWSEESNPRSPNSGWWLVREIPPGLADTLEFRSGPGSGALERPAAWPEPCRGRAAVVATR